MTNYIWDFDGTLFDTYEFITLSFQKALEDFHVTQELDIIQKEVKISVDSAIKKYSAQHQLQPNLLSESYKRHSHEYDYNLMKPYENVEAVLQKIVKQGGKNYINTHRGNNTLETLKFYNLDHYFVEIVSSENGFARKPNPDAIIYLIKKYNMNPKETMYIGDREIDILCGKNANILTCFFNTENQQCELADYHVKDYKEFIF